MKEERRARILSIAVGIALSSLFLSGAVRGQIHSKEKFTSKEGAFAVKMPGEPTRKSTDISSKIGPTTLYTFTVEEPDGKSFYMVGYSDYQGKIDEPAALNDVISSQVASIKGTITTDKRITLNGHPGRTVTIEDEENIFYSSIYIAGGRLYQVMYGMPKGGTLPAVGSEFLSSFEILI